MNHIPSLAPKTGDDLLEHAIKEVGAAVALRVTPADIEENIVSEHYFTAEEAAMEAEWPHQPVELGGPLSLLTICVLVLQNGFTVVGTSACASPANFNADIGKRLAREKAIDQLWALMGYELKCRLHNQTKQHV